MKPERIKVIYIVGNGHSGSTLLDIMLGNGESCFGAGELTNIVKPDLENEYCSCGQRIAECEFWSKVYEKWHKIMSISPLEYRYLRNRYERNKMFFITLLNSILPSKNFKLYQRNTQLLFECIKEVSGASIIIDSSKSPQRIAVLKSVVDIKAVHLCREFKGVLNSAKHSLKKDLSRGIENDRPARRTSKAFFDWLLTNVLSEIFLFRVQSLKLTYSDYIENPQCYLKIDDSFQKIINQELFSAQHMLSGNHLRLTKNIKICYTMVN
jgi:hypothetical protein